MKTFFYLTVSIMIFLVATAPYLQCSTSQKETLRTTTLHLAASANKVKQCLMLLEKDSSSINLLDESRNTPLHYAAYNGNYELCKLLLQYGASESIGIRGKKNNTPLHYAAKKGHHHICCLLKIHNASLIVTNSEGQRPFDVIPEDCDTAYVNPQDLSDSMVFEMELSLKALLRPFNDIPVANDQLQTLKVRSVVPESQGYLSPDDDLHWKNIRKPLFVTREKLAHDLEKNFMQR